MTARTGGDSALAATLGYGVREVAGAVVRQAHELAFARGLRFTTDLVEAYAAELAAVGRVAPPA